MLGVTTRVRKVPPSQETLDSLGKYRTKREMVGHLAINPLRIERRIAILKANIIREMAMMRPMDRKLFIEKGPIDFVKDKENRKKYTITCSRCGEKVAYLWADNEQLDNWCDMHYLCWHDKKSWYGAMAIKIDPDGDKIGIECACGEDTRNFRGNRTMPPIQKQLLIEYGDKHRDLGKSTSKFIAIEDKK